MSELREAAEIQCPVCGYYCLGNGGIGCIDKPYLYEAALSNQPEPEGTVGELFDEEIITQHAYNEHDKVYLSPPTVSLSDDEMLTTMGVSAEASDYYRNREIAKGRAIEARLKEG